MGRSRDHLRGCKHDEAGVSGEGRAAQARRSGCVPGHPNGCHQKPRLFPADSRGGRRHLRQRHSAGSARPSTARARSRVRTPGPSRGAGRPAGRLSAVSAEKPRPWARRDVDTVRTREPSRLIGGRRRGQAGQGGRRGRRQGGCRFGVEPRTPRLVPPHPSFQRPARKRPRLGGGGAAREPAGSPPWRSRDTARAPPSGARPGPLRPPRHEHHGPQSAALGPWLFPLAQSP